MNSFEKRVAQLAMIALDPYVERGDPPLALISAISELRDVSAGELNKRLGGLITMFSDDLSKWPEHHRWIAHQLREFHDSNPDASNEEQKAAIARILTGER
jgi:hypothetical protein